MSDTLESTAMLERAGWRLDVAAAVLGGIAAAALPPLCLLPALWLAIPGLLALIAAAPRARRAFRAGFWFGFGHHLLGLYWITDAILIEAAKFWWFVPIAVPGLAAVLALFIAIPCALAWWVRPGWRRLLVLAGAWTLADLARQFIGGGFPWNPLGSSWALPGFAGDVLLQPVAWIGTPGVTLLTLLLAGLPSLPARRRAAMAGGAMLLLWVGFGLWRLHSPAGRAPGVTVVLVQGDVPEGAKSDEAAAARIFQRYLDLTAQGVANAGAGAKIVVWPETASPYLMRRDSLARLSLAEAANGGTPGPVPALVGSVRFGRDRRPRNSLIAVSGQGGVLGIYDKFHLVPGGEYQPAWLPLPVQIVPGGGFAPGHGPATLALPGLPSVGALICYEAIFPGQVVASPRPDWLVNITNDAWFGNSTGPRQHLAAARMRAVEEGLPLMRAANTGISAGFDAHGHELGRLGLEAEGNLVFALPGKLPPPPFARWGLAIPALLALASIGVGVGRVARRG